MKDRLRVAKELLSENGVILCHIKEDAIHWLKVLMEEIFYTDNFVETFIWKNTDNPDSLSNKSRSSVEYIICFEKHKNSAIAYKGKETENGDAPLLNAGNNAHELIFPPHTIRFNIEDGIYSKGMPDRVELLNDVIVEGGENANEVRLKGEFKWAQNTLDKEISEGTYFIIKTNKFSIRFQRPQGTLMAPEKYIEEQYLSKAIGVGSNEDASTHLKNMGIDFTNSKPESVVAFFVRAMTEERDIVLDFFVGSGTTAAVAHKMNRRYIAVDQMDYIETETIKRMNLVIQGEQGGISQAIGWNPNNVGLLDGDKYAHNSFLYMELAQANQKLVEEIEAATDTKSLQQIWKQMQEKGFMSYKVKPSEIDKNVALYEELSLDDQKRFLIECLDKNLLYVPFEEMDDATYQMSEHDKQLTRQFYARR
jgi:adenine-specific DNA-methyltransferase